MGEVGSTPSNGHWRPPDSISPSFSTGRVRFRGSIPLPPTGGVSVSGYGKTQRLANVERLLADPIQMLPL